MRHVSIPAAVLALMGIALWATAAEPSDPFEDCGELIQGVECILFDSDNFGLYVLQNLDGFGVGDRVFVTGKYDPDCITFCMQGDGCILDNTIEECDGTPSEDTSWSEIKSRYRR